jgi:hypothetical protein
LIRIYAIKSLVNSGHARLTLLTGELAISVFVSSSEARLEGREGICIDIGTKRAHWIRET